MLVEMILVAKYLYKDFPETFDIHFCQNDRPCSCDRDKLDVPFLQVGASNAGRLVPCLHMLSYHVMPLDCGRCQCST